MIVLMTHYFLFFSLNLLFTPVTGPYWPLLISLPVIFLLNNDLRRSSLSSQNLETRFMRRATNLGITFIAINLLILLISIALSALTLLAASVIIMIYLAVLIIIIFKYLPLKPLEEDRIDLRVIAGQQMQAKISFKVKTRIGARLFLISKHDWLKVSPEVFQLKGEGVTAEIVVTPSLAGSTIVDLEAYVIDQWGLIQVWFKVKPVNLMVIPRARYAKWIAEKYLSGTKPGELPLIANISSLQTAYGLRQGIEYYGNKMYQPGDSLKNIDWKHSYKYNELIVKEYIEFHGQSVIVLINLVAGNDEEQDILAYNILVSAVTLAQENIPVVLAAYTDLEVNAIKGLLYGQRLVLEALKIVKDILIKNDSIKYLEPPDIIRLKANIRRMQEAESQAAGILGKLLQMEYQSISLNAKHSPLMEAYKKATDRTTQEATIIVISHRNHDAYDLAYNEYIFSRNGPAVINI